MGPVHSYMGRTIASRPTYPAIAITSSPLASPQQTRREEGGEPRFPSIQEHTRRRSTGAAGDEDLRSMAGLPPEGVEPQLALPHRIRHHRLPHRQDDRKLHRGGPQELQVRPGAQEALSRVAAIARKRESDLGEIWSRKTGESRVLKNAVIPSSLPDTRIHGTTALRYD